MKYIDTYKIFEAKIRKNFIDWLENPQAPKEDSVYKFEFPVKKVFNIKENINFKNLVNFLIDERGVDICKDISNEVELDFMPDSVYDDYDESEPSPPIVSEEEVEANFEEYFNKWLEQKFQGDMTKFYRMYDLDFEENQISEYEFDQLKENFNQQEIGQFYPAREYNQDFKILTMEIDRLEDDNKVIGSIETSRHLTDDEIDSINDFLCGQFSDTWGRSYEGEQEEEEINGLKFWTSIKTWWSDGYPEWYLNISTL